MPYKITLDWGVTKYFYSHAKACLYLFRTYMVHNRHEEDAINAAAWNELIATEKISGTGKIESFEFEDDNYDGI